MVFQKRFLTYSDAVCSGEAKLVIQAVMLGFWRGRVVLAAKGEKKERKTASSFSPQMFTAILYT